MNFNLPTKHERHARLIKIVRADYQQENPGSRLFPNTSGWAWQGKIEETSGGIILRSPRPIRFGIPEPAKGEDDEGSGGADLLGETIVEFDYMEDGLGGETIGKFKTFPVLTGVECKTGNSRLKKNQKAFRKWLLSIGGIWRLARECPSCWKRWSPVKASGRIIGWNIPQDCECCQGKGYTLQESEK